MDVMQRHGLVELAQPRAGQHQAVGQRLVLRMDQQALFGDVAGPQQVALPQRLARAIDEPVLLRVGRIERHWVSESPSASFSLVNRFVSRKLEETAIDASAAEAS